MHLPVLVSLPRLGARALRLPLVGPPPAAISPRRRHSSCAAPREDLSHEPVMTEEVLDILRPRDGQLFLDMTFGGGGHTRALLEAARCTVVAADRDSEAFAIAQHLAAGVGGEGEGRPVVPVLARFSELGAALRSLGLEHDSFHGVLLDAGCSSLQLDSAARGFSISRDGPLDMRMDGDRYPEQPTAADILNHLDVADLTRILRRYGEERYAAGIAEAVCESRQLYGALTSTRHLVQLVETVVEKGLRTDKLLRKTSSATKTFQAIRIFVNNELNELNVAVDAAYRCLQVGGVMVALTFHSLEDRIVKHHFKSVDPSARMRGPVHPRLQARYAWHSERDAHQVMRKRWRPLNKHVLVPGAAEVDRNPRARSARLRAASKEL